MNLGDELSFREKSILASLLAVLLVYGGYFAEVLTGAAEPTLGAMLAASIGVIVALVIIEIVLHIVLAMSDVQGAESPKDERDLLVSGRAARISQVVLSVGVVIVLGRIIVRGAMDETAGLGEVTLFEVANLLLFFLVLTELVNYGAQLFFYRRGV